MNITLSADQKLIEQARRFAKKQNTSLNNLIREYLQSMDPKNKKEDRAKEFTALARQFGGKSPEGFKFTRDAIYDRSNTDS